MNYLNWEKLDALDGERFRAQAPYPWINPAGLLTDAAFESLVSNLPDLSLFEKDVGGYRHYGQKSHDRYSLEYKPGVRLPPPWQEFVDELQSKRYLEFIRHFFGVQRIKLKYHWHFSFRGCAVSPHCDATRKVGSHIFYLNTNNDWQEDWGGQTVVLDDEGKFNWQSAPEFADFKTMQSSQSIGNYSFLFARTDHSWHGVQEITAPEGLFRKVFIVVIDHRRPSFLQRSLQRLWPTERAATARE